MPKKKKGKGKKKGKKGKKGKKKSRVAPAPYHPIKLDENYRFGSIIANTVQQRARAQQEAMFRIQQGGETVREINSLSTREGVSPDEHRGGYGSLGGDDGLAKLLRLARLGLDELPPGLPFVQNLTALDLSSNRLFDIDATIHGISFCTELRELNLCDNQLTGSVGADLCKCIHLEVLSLKRNNITELPVQLSQSCPALRHLDLSHNCIKELPGWLPDLEEGRFWPELRNFDVSANNLIALWPNLGVLSGLEQFRCAKNTITVLPTSIGKLTRLQLLDISANCLLTLPVELASCTNLRTLNISANGLARIDSKILEHLGNNGLRLLFAHKNRIGSVPPAIGHLTSVQILSLASNKIAQLPAEIGGLENLQELYLSGNTGLRAIPPSCQNWTNLRALYCQGCVKLKQLPLQIGLCRNLRDLNVLSGKKKQTCVVYQSILDSVPGIRLRGGKVKKNKKKHKAPGGAPMPVQ